LVRIDARNFELLW